ncbi:MAG: ATP-binding cassette, subfamily B, bacterial [Parcubacteria group bacterium Gr01-1014_70]|nr:MAG: ATP-binding cassette, subfamily B, bacterial [Parcubacteria group bacterium Gr01-1014_70]
METIVPLYYKQFFDLLASVSAPTSDVMQRLFFLIVIITGLYVIVWLFRRINQFTNIYVQPHVKADLMRTSFEYLECHSYKFFSNNFAGSLVRRINRLDRSFETLADQIHYVYLPFIVTFPIIIVILFLRHWLLGVVFTVWFFVFLVTQYAITVWKQKYNIMLAAKDSETTGVLSDSISNITTVKSFAGEAKEYSMVHTITEELRCLRFKTWTIDEWINTVQGALFIVVEIGLLYTAVFLWQRGIVTIGDFALIQAYIIRAFERVWYLGQTVRKSYEALAEAHEMVEILDTPHEVRDRPRAKKLTVSKGEIEFQSVSFNFNETRSILKGFDLHIKGGEKVALVGPSGAGKTTITKLLFRFYDVTAGVISIDGTHIAMVTQESLRHMISLVPQEPILFHRTLMENIRYGRFDASDKEVEDAAKKAHCHEFISQLPEGYNTYVGERGIKLSGGERQRVAIARAILKNAPILVLDEATSSLDSESEMLIQDALSVLMEGKTVIVIAHRLSTIMKMDRIIVMEGGAITAQGTHTELLEKGGVYKKLWEIQAGGFIR